MRADDEKSRSEWIAILEKILNRKKFILPKADPSEDEQVYSSSPPPVTVPENSKNFFILRFYF